MVIKKMKQIPDIKSLLWYFHRNWKNTYIILNLRKEHEKKNIVLSDMDFHNWMGCSGSLITTSFPGETIKT